MGVPGLWDILRPAVARQSLATLSRHAFQTSPLRALTIGIDASIWIFHAQVPLHGENPFLRTIFYKITSLLQHPILPIFVFDGPDKPGFKRNQRIAGGFGTSDLRSREFKALLDELGLEWWNAPGEAEAELAMMNRQGRIDAVLSDDVDALLFGATCLIRNNSAALTGNNKSATDKGGYDVYRSEAITESMTSREGTALTTEDECRLAMVFIALLAGGDYVPEGLNHFGPVIAHGLAHAGMADILKLYLTDPEAFDTELSITHGKIIEELQTNATGHVGKKYTDRASKLGAVEPAALFPTVALDAYLRPSTSASKGVAEWPGFGRGERSIRRGKARNEGRGDLEGMARACEKFFEWGTKDIVARRFASESLGVYCAEIISTARRMSTAAPTSIRSSSPSHSSPPLPTSSQSSAGVKAFFQVVKPASQATTKNTQSSQTAAAPRRQPFQVQSTRESPTDPGETELRLSYEHAAFSSRVRVAMAGTRVDPKDLDVEMRRELGLVDRDVDSTHAQAAFKDEQRVWLPDYLIRQTWPEVLDAYEESLRRKEAAKNAKAAKMPRAKVVPVKKAKSMANVDAPEAVAFKSFFSMASGSMSQGPARDTRKASTSASSTASTPLTSPPPEMASSVDADTDSDIEIIENPQLSGNATKPKRIHPASSLSSIASSSAPASADVPGASPARRQTRSITATSARKTSPRRLRAGSKTGSRMASRTPPRPEVIDLCDSTDDDTPRAVRTAPVLNASNADNVTRLGNRRAPRSPKKKSRATTAATTSATETTFEMPTMTQRKLDLPITMSSQASRSTRMTQCTSPTKCSSPERAMSERAISTELRSSPSKEKAPKSRYKPHPIVLMSDTSDEEVIDLIRR